MTTNVLYFNKSLCFSLFEDSLSVTKTTQSQMKGWQVNDEIIIVWKEVVVIIQEFSCWD
jgi:hypothetical protein